MTVNGLVIKNEDDLNTFLMQKQFIAIMCKKSKIINILEENNCTNFQKVCAVPIVF